jgi:hypothetical protein
MTIWTFSMKEAFDVFICICSWGGLVQDVWVKPTLEEARISLAETCFGSFDPETDDARVFEKPDGDDVCVEVYSFDEADFTFVPSEEPDGEPTYVFTGNDTEDKTDAGSNSQEA